MSGYTAVNLSTVHTTPRGGIPVGWIVVHTTEGNATLAKAAAYLAQNGLGVSAHEVVGDGAAFILAPDRLATHHAGAFSARLPSGEAGHGVNLASWGIEIHNRAGQPPSAGAYRVAVERIAEACKRLRLPVEKIIAHRDVDPSRRSDPTGVNMDALRADVQALLNPKPPAEPLPKHGRQIVGKAAYYGELLKWALEGDATAGERLAASLLAEPREVGAQIAAAFGDIALAPLIAERNRS